MAMKYCGLTDWFRTQRKIRNPSLTYDWIESCERAAVWNVAASGARLRMMMS
jgi:hypothetical protein